MRRSCCELLLLLFTVMACAGEAGSDATIAHDTSEDVATSDVPAVGDIDSGSLPQSGEFVLLTYNVAGLPEGISGSHPEAYMPLISPLLNSYDLVVVQEDFWYHEELAAQAEHPYQSEPMFDNPSTVSEVGDGLNRFSNFPFGEFTRIPWDGCHGVTDCASDCFATKGFSVARTELPGGVVVDVYNHHAEAGSCEEDIKIRAAGVQQMIDEIESRSAGMAVILAGDTNLHVDQPCDRAPYERLLSEVHLTDACTALDCGVDTIDRVFFRSSDAVTLQPLAWERPQEFVDAEGNDLSDHRPTMVRFRWETK